MEYEAESKGGSRLACGCLLVAAIGTIALLTGFLAAFDLIPERYNISELVTSPVELLMRFMDQAILYAGVIGGFVVAIMAVIGLLRKETRFATLKLLGAAFLAAAMAFGARFVVLFLRHL